MPSSGSWKFNYSNPQITAYLEIAENIASRYVEQLFHPTLNIHGFLTQVNLMSPGDNINLFELNVVCI